MVRSSFLKEGMKQTLGTETSKYREEKTSNEIPVVAASEPGGAQRN
jgi:hypothetical protein